MLSQFIVLTKSLRNNVTKIAPWYHSSYLSTPKLKTNIYLFITFIRLLMIDKSLYLRTLLLGTEYSYCTTMPKNIIITLLTIFHKILFFLFSLIIAYIYLPKTLRPLRFSTFVYSFVTHAAFKNRIAATTRKRLWWAAHSYNNYVYKQNT